MLKQENLLSAFASLAVVRHGAGPQAIPIEV